MGTSVPSAPWSLRLRRVSICFLADSCRSGSVRCLPGSIRPAAALACELVSSSPWLLWTSVFGGPWPTPVLWVGGCQQRSVALACRSPVVVGVGIAPSVLRFDPFRLTFCLQRVGGPARRLSCVTVGGFCATVSDRASSSSRRSLGLVALRGSFDLSARRASSRGCRSAPLPLLGRGRGVGRRPSSARGRLSAQAFREWLRPSRRPLRGAVSSPGRRSRSVRCQASAGRLLSAFGARWPSARLSLRVGAQRRVPVSLFWRSGFFASHLRIRCRCVPSPRLIGCSPRAVRRPRRCRWRLASCLRAGCLRRVESTWLWSYWGCSIPRCRMSFRHSSGASLLLSSLGVSRLSMALMRSGGPRCCPGQCHVPAAREAAWAGPVSFF